MILTLGCILELPGEFLKFWTLGLHMRSITQRSQRCGVERGQRARHQTFSGLSDFRVLPGLALVALRVLGRSPQLIALLGA